MEKITALRLSEEENEILEKAFNIIDDLTDEAADTAAEVSDYYVSWTSEKLLYRIGLDFIVNGKDMEKCFDILQALQRERDITFSIKED